MTPSRKSTQPGTPNLRNRVTSQIVGGLSLATLEDMKKLYTIIQCLPVWRLNLQKVLQLTGTVASRLSLGRSGLEWS